MVDRTLDDAKTRPADVEGGAERSDLLVLARPLFTARTQRGNGWRALWLYVMLIGPTIRETVLFPIVRPGS